MGIFSDHTDVCAYMYLCVCIENSKCLYSFSLYNQYLYQGFSNFLLDAPLVTKFNFHSLPNKLIEY